MSDGHEHDHDHDDAADAHHDHFDNEPARELGPDEPHTPGWVPMVGAAIFVIGAVLFVTQREATPASGANDGAPGTQQTVAAPMQPRPVQPLQAQPAQGQPRPAASGGPQGIKQLNPDQVKDLQKRIQEARQKAQEAGGAK
jgi:hypothetical protein